ncbi:MAG: glucose 1-dehydrogenase [Planctomycetota bacterium]|nr:glucose 1-dehydrogenase [Planctomycetota bacterium]
MSAPLPFEGRTAVVTGASRGIGAAIARRLAQDGAHVGLVARHAGPLKALAAELAGAPSGVTALIADVTDPSASEAAVARLLAERGRIDVLVNNAGGNVRRSAADTDLALWNDLIRLGLTAPFHWASLCAPSMRAQRAGRIVNIGSVAGATALPTGAAYAAAKAGLAQLTRNLAREWGPDGVTVNLLAPWYVPTPLTEGVLSDPGFRSAVLACTPVGRLGTPEDVAAAVAFLCGDEASWLNGAVIPLDGGFSAASFYP